jgi:hypothetical protein
MKASRQAERPCIAQLVFALPGRLGLLVVSAADPAEARYRHGHHHHHHGGRAAWRAFGLIAGTIAGIAAAEQARRDCRRYGYCYGYG